MAVVNIEGIQAAPGERTVGYIETSRTASQIPIHIPLVICNGAEDGPTLMVSAAVHGQEINGTMGLGKVLRELDESKLKGTLLALPVVNTSGFEFGTRTVYWDGQNFSRNVGGADPEGSPTQQLQDVYFNKLLPHADALVDIHSGRPGRYVNYTGFSGNFTTPEIKERAKKMAIAFGLKQVWSETPSRWGGDRPASDTPRMLVEYGGGADLLKNDKLQMNKCAQGILNVMRLMGMLEGEIEHESEKVQIVRAFDAEIWSGTNAGIMILECEHGDYLKKGDAFASFYHPFTGEKMSEITVPMDGMVLNTGARWPVVGQGEWMGVLGEVVEEVPFKDFDLTW